jgi:hypothetical protein
LTVRAGFCLASPSTPVRPWHLTKPARRLHLLLRLLLYSPSLSRLSRLGAVASWPEKNIHTYMAGSWRQTESQRREIHAQRPLSPPSNPRHEPCPILKGREGQTQPLIHCAHGVAQALRAKSKTTWAHLPNEITPTVPHTERTFLPPALPLTVTVPCSPRLPKAARSPAPPCSASSMLGQTSQLSTTAQALCCVTQQSPRLLPPKRMRALPIPIY